MAECGCKVSSKRNGCEFLFDIRKEEARDVDRQSTSFPSSAENQTNSPIQISAIKRHLSGEGLG